MGKLTRRCSGQRLLKPRRVQAEKFAVGRHDVHYKLPKYPAASRRARPHVVVESQDAKPGLQIGVTLRGHDFENHINVVSRALRQETWIFQEKIDDRTSDECVVETEIVEALGDRA